MATQNNLQDLHKEAKNIIPKEPTRYFLFVQINYQIIRNQSTFASAKCFDYKKKIFTMYDSSLAEILLVTKEKPINQLMTSPQPSSF